MEESLIIQDENAIESHTLTLLRETEILAKTGSWEYDFNTKKLEWSDGVYELLDCKPQSFKANLKKGLQFVHPDDIEQLLQNLRDTNNTGKDFTYQFRFQTKKGVIKHIRTNGRVIRDHVDDNSILKIIGVFQDITDQTTAKKELDKTFTDLQERIKELSSLYQISRLSHFNYTPDELLEQSVTYLPSGWQFPDVASACIEYGQKKYRTENYKPSIWSQSAERETIEGHHLKITVAYHQQVPEADEGVFLSEERQLIESITDNLLANINQFESQRNHELLLESTEEGI
ncbi:MAG: PAS domain-containing protein, partial [Candidatus Paceibacterota bacterium]